MLRRSALAFEMTEDGRVHRLAPMVDPHAHPGLVGGEVVDAVGACPAELPDHEVMHQDPLGIALGPQLLAAVAEGPDALLLLGVDADDRLAERELQLARGAQVGELGVPVGMACALEDLAVGLEAVAQVVEQLRPVLTPCCLGGRPWCSFSELAVLRSSLPRGVRLSMGAGLDSRIMVDRFNEPHNFQRLANSREQKGVRPVPLDMSIDPRSATEPLWYKVQVDRLVMRGLQGRDDRHGLVYFGAWVILQVIFGALTLAAGLPAWLRVIAFVAFATVYCFSESFLHETHHRTAFRTSWLNGVVHYIAGMAAFKEPIRDRWLHAAHHTFTSYPDLDPETASEPPPNLWLLVLDLVRFRYVYYWFGAILRNAVGPDVLTRRYVPPTEHAKITWSARFLLFIYATVVAVSVLSGSWWPCIFIFGGRFIGAWMHAWITFGQHVALAQSVPDWRLNTRTIYLNPVAQFLVWNMNFHVEHHMYPTVPFHHLPELHAAIAYDCPPPYRSSIEAWREMVVGLFRQRKDPSYYIQRPLPQPAA
jgi:fatty acid desaturase